MLFGEPKRETKKIDLFYSIALSDSVKPSPYQAWAFAQVLCVS